MILLLRVLLGALFLAAAALFVVAIAADYGFVELALLASLAAASLFALVRLAERRAA